MRIFYSSTFIRFKIFQDFSLNFISLLWTLLSSYRVCSYLQAELQMNKVSLAVPRKKRRHRILQKTKGFYGRRKNCFRLAIKAKVHADERRYVGKKLLKRDQRRKWNKMISIWAGLNGSRYSLVINDLLARYGDRKSIYREIIRLSASDPLASVLISGAKE